MKNNAHTTGPWLAPENKSQYINTRNIVGGDGKVFAHISFSHQSREMSDAEMRANAKLMAAAPDLLEALIEAEALLQRFYESPSLASTSGAAAIDDSISSIRAAIAKAA